MPLDPRRYLSTAWQRADWKGASQDLAERLVRLATEAGAYIKGLRLGDLADVDFRTLPTNGQVPVWNDTAKKWRPGTVGGGGGGGFAGSFRAYKAANYSSVANVFTILYDTVEYDDLSGYNAATGEYTPAATGLYVVGVGSLCSTALGATDYVSPALMWNNGAGGVLVGVVAQNLNVNFTNSTTVGSGLFYLTAGRPYYISHNCSGHPWTFGGGSASLWFAAARVA